MAIAAALAASGVDFYVALSGDDANPGAAKPFASLTRARDAVCSSKFRAPHRDYEFLLREGVHGLTQNRRLLPRRLRLKPESPGRQSASCPSTRFSFHNLSGSAPTVVAIDRAFHPMRSYFFL
ncbi:MAG: hypothetical protein NTX09_20195 [Verrucomicrobia bacterium]|nr:hypothetical protein [Verrucomicrobiota bacterium]